jgi:hypothetical protein
MQRRPTFESIDPFVLNDRHFIDWVRARLGLDGIPVTRGSLPRSVRTPEQVAVYRRKLRARSLRSTSSPGEG